MQRFGMPDPAKLSIINRNVGTGQLTFGNYTRFLFSNIYIEMFRNKNGRCLSDRVGTDDGRTMIRFVMYKEYADHNSNFIVTVRQRIYPAKLYLIRKDGQHVHDQ